MALLGLDQLSATRVRCGPISAPNCDTWSQSSLADRAAKRTCTWETPIAPSWLS